MCRAMRMAVTTAPAAKLKPQALFILPPKATLATSAIVRMMGEVSREDPPPGVTRVGCRALVSCPSEFLVHWAGRAKQCASVASGH
jgi:hypothetical protein